MAIAFFLFSLPVLGSESFDSFKQRVEKNNHDAFYQSHTEYNFKSAQRRFEHSLSNYDRHDGILDLSKPEILMLLDEVIQYYETGRADEAEESIPFLLNKLSKQYQLHQKDYEIIARLPNLKHLTLDRIQVSDRDVATIGKNRELKHLSLRSDFYDPDFGIRNFSNTVSDKSLKVIGKMTHLEYLDLWGARVYGRGLEHLEHLISMRHLDLGYTFIIGSRLRHLSEMKLETLNLDWTRVDDEDLDHITGLKKLTRLNLQDTKLTNKAIARLEQLPALEWLDISGTAITQNGVEQLQNQLPNLEIIASHLHSDDPLDRTPERSDMW